MIPHLLLFAALVQPVPYSHKQHLAMGLKCKSCHPNPDPGDRMTLPPTATCLSCHSTGKTLAKYAKSKEPIPWQRVYVVSAAVYWSHRTHTAAGLSCQDCHGDVSQMEVMTKVKDLTSMAACVDCHSEHQAGLGCDLCHEGK